ncbi:MAG: ATP-dependent Clp protease ATP-binding subunit [Clostridiales bacterium]|nr:ATP-dependent Clp protease ATP-binding subunit [Clostridiales bacterium]
MELSRYTDAAVNALSGAQEAARSFGHSFVGSEHLLMGIIKCGDKTAEKLAELGVTAEEAAPYIDTVVGGGRNIFTDSFGNTQTVKRILELSLYEAKSMGADLIGTEHILLSIMRERDSTGARIVETLCRDREALRAFLQGGSEKPYEEPERFEEPAESPKPAAPAPVQRNGLKSSTPILDTYCRNLSRLAALGRIDPVIGREAEINRVLQTLCRRTKNNPVLIGEPGVGKSAIAEGLAVRIAEGKVPESLEKKRILSLDLGAMIAGTRYRGEFEERLKTALEELSNDENTILFIDEIHTIVGAGSGEGSVDAANIMKPALARGELRVIGATTIDEYRTYIEKDAALERRFSPILVSEPTEEQTRTILEGLRPRYEEHHGVRISDEAISSAIELSIRYVADRRLPDKAIDLMDEACSRARLIASEKSLEKRIERAAEKGDFELAEKLRNELKQNPNKGETPCVSASDIAAVVSERTGMDVSADGGYERLNRLESKLKAEVFGQDEAIDEISAILRRSAAGLGDAARPFASLILAGPANTGKKTLIERLAETVFNSSVIRLNGGELADDSAVIRLVGAPSGYKDAEKGGRLTEFVRLHPVSVILVGSAELCSAKVLSLMTDILMNGRIEDGRGRTVSFRNCLIALCVDTDARNTSVGFANGGTDTSKDVRKAAASVLPASVISFADAVIVFNKLDKNALSLIVKSKLNDLKARAFRKGVSLEFDEGVVCGIAAASAGDASNIARLISIHAEDAVSLAVLNREIKSGDSAEVLFENGNYIVRKVEK